MQTLTDRLSGYTATRVGTHTPVGLWNALIACDASVLPPDPVSDARVAEIKADVARQALISHLAKL